MHPCDNVEALLRVLSPARRNHPFHGKRIDVQHFQMEQDYGKLKQWMLNRLTLGKGVVCGLKVSIDGNRFCVDPGVAIDGLGREIVVPVRQCIDPTTNDGGCCVPCCDEARPTPPPSGPPDTSVPLPERPGGSGGRDDDRDDVLRLYTLWLCYKECKTDFQPVLVSECQAPQPCAAGTIVETFCLKVAPGAPLQQDPDWCALLWPRRRPDDPQRPGSLLGASDFTAEPAGPGPAPGVGPAGGNDTLVANPRDTGPDQPTDEEIQESLDSRRRILCGLFGETCDVDEGDPCVPLGVFTLRGRTITRFDACLVRPRIYSNARLLDLILCLADRMDDCCRHQEPMRLSSVAFLNRGAAAGEAPITTMTNPLVDTPIDIERNMNAIRIRFTQAFAQDQRKPSTPAVNDADFKRHNVQILPDAVLNNVPYVAGTLTIESGNTVRFDLSPESPYRRSQGGWHRGRYRIFLRGDENLPVAQQALANVAGAAFDGEPIAPAAGVISGNNTPGGDFVGAFVITRTEQPDTLRVREVEFVNRNPSGGETMIARVNSPLQNTPIASGFASMRIRLTKPLAAAGPARPTTHGPNDADFRRHNVQVLVTEGNAATGGAEFVPGRLVIEAPDTLRFDVARGSPIVDEQGDWPPGTTRYRILLRGSAQAGRPALTDTGGKSLDGEPIAPAGGVISGSGAAGGDFNADFSVVTPT